MELKGKSLTLVSKIMAAVFVLACFVLMAVTDIRITIDDVIKVGVFIALVFSPVDISLWLEKFTPDSNLLDTDNKNENKH